MSPDLNRDFILSPDLNRDFILSPDLNRDFILSPDLNRDFILSPDLNTDFSCPHFVFRYLKVSTQDFRHYQYQAYKFFYFFNDEFFEARNFGCFLKCTLKYQVICVRLSQKFKQNSIIFGCYFPQTQNSFHCVYSMPCSMPHVSQLTVCCSMSYNQLICHHVVHLVVYLCTVQHNLGKIGRSKLLNNQQY